MIILKSRLFCSIIRHKMFNLDEYQFSNVSKNDSKTIKSAPISIITQEKLEKVEQKAKNKQKKYIADPIQTYKKIKEWRLVHIAPVDTIGCERLAEKDKPDDIQKYQILISLMISVQTTDQTTSMVVKRLQEYGLNPQNISKTSQIKLIELIYESNFNKRKAKNIIQVSRIILKNGLPKNKQQLLQLPGIGIKIAMIYLRTAEGIEQGIGVDTHVHRISNRLGWVKTSNPNQTEKSLQQVFPKQFWTDLNINLVGFGQLICNAKKPLCSQCPVKNVCPSSLIKQNKVDW